MAESPRPISLLYLATTMSIVGTSLTANKYIIGRMPIMLASEIRFMVASAVLWSLLRVIDGRFPAVPPRLHVYLALQALFGVFGFNALMLLGTGWTTATIAGIITATTPAMIAVISAFLGDKLAPLAWVGIGLTIGGVAMVNLLATPDSDAARRPVAGAVLITFAVVGEALYTVLGRTTARDLTPLTTASWITTYGALMFLPFAIVQIPGADLAGAPLSAWVALVWLAIPVTVVAFALWFVGLRHVPASIAGAFTGMIPVTAVLSAWLFLNERIQPIHIAAIALVLIGIILVSRSRGRVAE